MRSRFIISESDRRNILSMYGLLTEEEREITINGTVIDEKNETVIGAKITIYKDEKLLTGTRSDDIGQYEIKLNADNGDLIIKCEVPPNQEAKQTLTIQSEKNIYNDVNFILTSEKIKSQQNITASKKSISVKGKFLDSKNNRISGATVYVIIQGEKQNLLNSPEYKEKLKNLDLDYEFIKGEKIEDATFVFEKEGYRTIKKTFDFTKETKYEYDPKFFKIVIPCQDYVSTEQIFYGKNNSKDFKETNKGLHDEVVIKAKKDALKQYIKKYPFKDVDVDEFYTKIEKSNSVPYKIVCEKYDTNKDNDIVKYITVEITKDDFDNLLRPKKLPEPKKIKSNKIDFINIPFVELIEKSFKENKPAFILFSNEDETISNDIKNKLNEDKMSVYALNNDYIPVEYINDESDQVGNIQAQDSLEISKIPSVAIIKGLETPVILDGSYSLIKKVSNFGSYFSRPDEYLETIKNLLT